MFQYLLSAIILVLLDGIYLSTIRNLYEKQIQTIQGSKIQLNLIASLITYIFLIFGLNYFIIKKHKSPMDAAILGMVIYGVYEFTNLALLKNWSIFISILDTVWGSILFGLTTIIVYKIKAMFRFYTF